MSDPRIVAVFNTTIPLAEAVARSLSRDTSLQVRAVTSDVTSPEALNLKNAGVELCECTFTDVDDVITALNGVDQCFIATYTDTVKPNCVEQEIQHGRLLADGCAMSNVKHVVFSTQIHTQKVKGIQVRPMVAKAEIEEYMREKNLPLTCIMVPCLYQDLFEVMKPEKVQNNTFQFENPVGLTSLDMIDREDIGGVVTGIIDNKTQYINKTIRLSAVKITIPEVAAILNVNLKPKMFREKQVSINDYRDKDIPASKDWANYFNFLLRVDTQYNVSMTKSINPNVKSFQQWVQENCSWIMSQLTA